MPIQAHRYLAEPVDSKRGTMLREMDVEDAGGKSSLIRVVTNPVIARAWRVHVAIAAQLLRGIGPVRTENVVDALFLALIGR